MAEPYSVIAFSGEGPHGVTPCTLSKSPTTTTLPGVSLRSSQSTLAPVLRFGMPLPYSWANARDIVCCFFCRMCKPNDIDRYEGVYGVVDMRQAVTEAKLQGVNPFCLTIDRQAANYLSAVFGAHQYALLPKPELLPAVLLEWMKRLVVT